MSVGDKARWAEVGRRIEQRIDELNLTKAEVIRLSGVSDKTLSGYIDGLPIRRRDKKRDLALALGWLPNSIDRILDGGEPEEAWEPPRRVIRQDVDLSDISNAHEFEYSVPADQLDRSAATVQPRGEPEQVILPRSMWERFERLEREVAALKAELAAERDRPFLSPEERAEVEASAERGIAQHEAKREAQVQQARREREEREARDPNV